MSRHRFPVHSLVLDCGHALANLPRATEAARPDATVFLAQTGTAVPPPRGHLPPAAVIVQSLAQRHVGKCSECRSWPHLSGARLSRRPAAAATRARNGWQIRTLRLQFTRCGWCSAHSRAPADLASRAVPRCAHAPLAPLTEKCVCQLLGIPPSSRPRFSYLNANL